MRHMNGSERLGIFGGTFDPIHVGHLVAAQDVLEALDLDRILFVPAHQSPHKERKPGSSARVRYRMVQAALEGDVRFRTVEIELRREPPSYTVDTVRELSEILEEDVRPFLLLGVDQWAAFGSWRRPREIVERAEPVVMTRGGSASARVDPGFTDGEPPKHREVPVTRVDISSSDVRARIREGRSIRYMVPEPVRRIIELEKLYSQ